MSNDVTFCCLLLHDLDEGWSAHEQRRFHDEDLARAVAEIERHGGQVEPADHLGPGVVGRFDETDGGAGLLSAVACALEILDVHSTVSNSRDSAIRVGIGLHGGTGDPLGGAWRLSLIASAGELVISEELWQRSKDCVEVETRDDGYRVTGMRNISAVPRPITWNFGKYELLAPIGQGGMGEVFSARRMVGDRLVQRCALKLMRRDVEPTREAVRRFIGEAKIAGSIRHPNIVELYEIGRIDGQHFVSMELVDGGSLFDAISNHSLYTTIPWTSRGPRFPSVLARMLDVAISIARGLDYVHRALDYKERPWGIIHRDVKSANVLFDAKGTAKVGDFGLAGVIAELHRDRVPGASPLISAGGMTAAYASPEQMNAVARAWSGGESIALTHKTDVWSWAVTVLEMFTGGVTWRAGAAAPAVLAGYRASGPPDGIPKMPVAVDGVLSACFANDPAERPEFPDVIRTLLEAGT